MARAIPILLYHGVGTEATEGLAPFVVDPGRFADHMRLVTDRGHTAFTVSGLCDLIGRGDPVPDDAVLITFDDGMADFADAAWPILRSHGLPATLYVVADHIGSDAAWLAPFGTPPPMLTWEQVRQLDAEGCEIGAHSATHPELDTLTSAELISEVRGSRTTLAVGLGHPVRSFAYPHGYHSRAVKESVRLAGFDSACAVRNILSSADDDRFALSRVTIEASCGTDALARVLDGVDLPVAPRRQQIRTVGWRTYRRGKRRLARAS